MQINELSSTTKPHWHSQSRSHSRGQTPDKADFFELKNGSSTAAQRSRRSTPPWWGASENRVRCSAAASTIEGPAGRVAHLLNIPGQNDGRQVHRNSRFPIARQPKPLYCFKKAGNGLAAFNRPASTAGKYLLPDRTRIAIDHNNHVGSQAGWHGSLAIVGTGIEL